MDRVPHGLVTTTDAVQAIVKRAGGLCRQFQDHIDVEEAIVRREPPNRTEEATILGSFIGKEGGCHRFSPALTPAANCTASSAARTRAQALFWVSWYSASGSLSTTTPPPACT